MTAPLWIRGPPTPAMGGASAGLLPTAPTPPSGARPPSIGHPRSSASKCLRSANALAIRSWVAWAKMSGARASTGALSRRPAAPPLNGGAVGRLRAQVAVRRGQGPKKRGADRATGFNPDHRPGGLRKVAGGSLPSPCRWNPKVDLPTGATSRQHHHAPLQGRRRRHDGVLRDGAGHPTVSAEGMDAYASERFREGARPTRVGSHARRGATSRPLTAAVLLSGSHDRPAACHWAVRPGTIR